MKNTMKNTVPATIAAILTMAASTSSSDAALTLIFQEVGGDVVLHASGTVDLGGLNNVASFPSSSDSAAVNSSFFRVRDESVTRAARLEGGSLVTQLFGAPGVGGHSSSVVGDISLEIVTNTSAIWFNHIWVGTGSVAAGELSVSAMTTFSGRTFASLGIDHHAKDMDFLFWENPHASGTDGHITFRLSTVPEPSSTALLGLGCFALVLRRRRG